MKKKILVPVFFFVMMISVTFPFCDVPDFSGMNDENEIVLLWNKGYETQTQVDVLRGMIWSFSYLGAELPRHSFNQSVEITDSTIITVDLGNLGFNENAKKALRVICDSIRRSDEYIVNGGIDAGKFFMLTLGTSEHYYRITGVPRTLDEFRKRYRIDSTAYVFGMLNSGISEGHRVIRFSRDTALLHIGFVAEEGTGSLEDSTFETTLFECFDFMPNGQLRYMVYDQNGLLVSGSPDSISAAGKPLKCMWCHEIAVPTLVIENHAVKNMLANDDFVFLRNRIQNRLDKHRLSLVTDMNFAYQPEHVKAELLYITYMEPTLMHLADEWNMSKTDAEKKLNHTPSYIFQEFDYIGRVYPRAQIDPQDTIQYLKVPESARELGREVNFFKDSH